ncbi:response regulator transcription factor [Magnetospirillum sp. UT-4]|uniref:LuxR C-terminal-related transcriptional regulator n=1 Tax=Magnetospirillum sp. UT-4 TaxID=2681467 RepID=UPI0013824DD2|nr:response regulator transcription factor [Magnetospirillum sp. UT-4]CAA7618382.1 Two-component response regulator [Magnetospirillum sp. UT-4]
MIVLIADDHALFRYGISLALEGLYGKDVTILQASSAEETRRIAQEAKGLDLILLDLMMPGLNGISDLKKFIDTLPPVPVVIVSGSRQRSTIRSAIECGARGYVLKSSNGEILKHVLPLVLSGELYVPAQAVANEEAAEGYEGSPLDEAGDFNPDFKSLTPRETQVLKLLTLGYSNKEIARSLGMLEGTVKVHVKSIMKKLGVNNRTQAAIAANRSFTRQSPVNM